MDMLPEYELFLNSERMTQFWEMVKWLLFFIAPVAMIFFAADLLKLFIGMIKKSFGVEKEKEEEDDYKIYRY